MPGATPTEPAITREERTRDGVSGIVPNVIPQPFLTFEQRAKGDGQLPVLITLVAGRKRTSVAQRIAPQFRKFVQGIETSDKRFDGSHAIGLAPSTAQRRVNRHHINRQSPQQYVHPATSCS